MSKKSKVTKPVMAPSLLDNEAKGGDIAEGGFSFQEGVILAKIPAWLRYDGFTAMIREAVCDAEAAFFDPSIGVRRDALEAKNHSLTPTEFWEEVDHFREIDQGSPGVFQWFTLVSAGLSAELRPLANGLRRVRDPYGFYDPTSPLTLKSLADCEAIVTGLEHSVQDADFLFSRVLIEPHWSLATDHPAALFKDGLSTFPEYQDYPGVCQQRAFQDVHALVKSHKNRPLPRHAIEEAIDRCRPASLAMPKRILRIHTAAPAAPCPTGAICFQWESFFGGTKRDYPPTASWSRVTEELKRFHDWARDNRRPRHVRISGDRRLSTLLAIGSVCSAVAGFTLDLENRDGLWSTDEHSSSTTPAYDLGVTTSPGHGHNLVVIVSCIRDVSPTVERFVKGIGLAEAPRLHVHGPTPIVSAAQCNDIVRQIKEHVATSLSSTSARQIHLFIAGPSPLALFLGHRLNATAPVQCYEWLGGDGYLPTVHLLG